MLALIIGAYFLISKNPAEAEQHYAVDPLDSRPAIRLLFIGNSRTYYNDMPALVQNMTKVSSSNSTTTHRYEIAMHAPGGHTFEDHSTNPTVQELLKQKWNYIILQGGSPENTNPDSSQSFLTHGADLIQRIQEQNSQPVLLTAWTYDEGSYEFENEHYLKPDYLTYVASYQAYIDHHGEPPHDRPAPDTFFPLDIEKHTRFIQNDYHTLASQSHALEVNVGGAFQKLLATNQRFDTLTTDGNHPNLQGSYLMAVMLHVCFSKVPASTINYTPPGLIDGDAQAIKAFVDHTYPDGTCITNNNENNNKQNHD